MGVKIINGSNRVNRGGSWNNNDNNCRVANRNNNNPDNSNNNLGFRLSAQQKSDMICLRMYHPYCDCSDFYPVQGWQRFMQETTVFYTLRCHPKNSQLALLGV